MPGMPIGLNLDKAGTTAGANLGHDGLQPLQQRITIVAVDLLNRHPKSRHAFCEKRDSLTAFDRGMSRVLVVFANNQKRKPVQGGKIEHLVEDALVEYTVAY